MYSPAIFLPMVHRFNIFNFCFLDSDSDSEPLITCACCNQITEEFLECISCNSCKRFFHYDCHIPKLTAELKPKEYFIFILKHLNIYLICYSYLALSVIVLQQPNGSVQFAKILKYM